MEDTKMAESKMVDTKMAGAEVASTMVEMMRIYNINFADVKIKNSNTPKTNIYVWK